MQVKFNYPPKKLLPRRHATSPLSANWTLYNPDKIYKELTELYSENPHTCWTKEKVKDILDKNGFSKSVRIRERLIKEKCAIKNSLPSEYKNLEILQRGVKNAKAIIKVKEDKLVTLRNILRIPREDKSRD
jgi:hypothetical protein